MQNAVCYIFACIAALQKANNDTSPATTDNATEFSAAKYIIVFIFWLYCIVFFSMSVDGFTGMGSLLFLLELKKDSHTGFQGSVCVHLPENSCYWAGSPLRLCLFDVIYAQCETYPNLQRNSHTVRTYDISYLYPLFGARFKNFS